jgi:small subunit ribosomal protein S2
MFYVSERWLGGTLTNRVTIKKSIAKMYEIDKLMESDESKGLKKKELASYSRKVSKLHKNLDGVARMKKLPAVMVVVDVNKDDIAVREAVKLDIPVVGICDTNSNPELVAYPVAANDDAVKSIKVIIDVFVDAILVAKEIHQKKVAEEKAAKEAEKAEKAEKDAAKKAEKKAQKEASKVEKTEKKVEAKKEAPKAEKVEKVEKAEKTEKKAETKKEAPKAEKAEKASKVEKTEKKVEAKEEAPKAEKEEAK